MLSGNTCFGCGPENPDGLRIRILRDGDRRDRLVGEYVPRATQEGFPRIVHGGLQFTALDCMAAWLIFGFRVEERSIPLTQSGKVRYRRPTPIDRALGLSSEIVSAAPAPSDSKAQEILQIRTELTSESGDVLTIADFEYSTVPESTFRRMMGIDELPDSFRRHFGDL